MLPSSSRSSRAANRRRRTRDAAHALRRVVAHPVLPRELVEAADRSLRREDPCAQLAILVTVAAEAEALDDRRERQPLDQQRPEEHRIDEEQHEVAVGERRAGVQRARDRQGCGERHGAAHAREGDEEDAAGLRLGLPRPHPSGQPARQVGRRIDPEEPHEDHRQQHHGRVPGQLRRG